MRYITARRYRGPSLGGEVNLPALTPVELRGDGVLYLGEKPLHYAASQRGHDYFARDDDGRGRERFRLCREIIKMCARHSAPGDPWGARLWETPALQAYRRPENDQRWLWNQRFFDAPVEELQWMFQYLKEG